MMKRSFVMDRIRSDQLLCLRRCGLMICLAVLGCGGDDRVPVSPVTGRLLYQGRGVAGATIIFHPADGVAEEAQKFRPYAYTDSEGRFVLKTYTDDDGAPNGVYRVSIVAIPASASTAGQAQRNEGSGADQPAGSGVDVPISVRRKYADVESAGIKVTIQDGTNELEPIVMQ